MSPPPTSIDGTDITGATIDGQEVQEITVDGQTVFTAAPVIPDTVLSQDLIAWYRFEGDFADSATGPSFGDPTAFDLTNNNGATAATSGGITDFENGQNSGQVIFSGGDFLRNSSISKTLSEYSVTFWHNADTTSFSDIYSFQNDSSEPSLATRISDNRIFWIPVDGGTLISPSGVTSYAVGDYVHISLTHSNGNQAVYQNGNQIFSDSQSGSATLSDFLINDRSIASGNKRARQSDDFRIYNRELTSSEVLDIYRATEP